MTKKVMIGAKNTGVTPGGFRAKKHRANSLRRIDARQMARAARDWLQSRGLWEDRSSNNFLFGKNAKQQ